MRLLITIIILVLQITSCSNHNSLHSSVEYSNVEAITSIFDYLTDKKFGHHLPQEKECTVIFPELTVLEKSFYYNIWHHQLLKQRDTIKTNDYLFRGLKQPLVQLDTVDLKKMVHHKESLQRVEEIGGHCIQYYKNEKDINNVLYFTPLIKMSSQDYYHMAMIATDDWDNAEFLFLLKQEKNGKFKVVHHIWGDDWHAAGIGDEIDILKGK